MNARAVKILLVEDEPAHASAVLRSLRSAEGAFSVSVVPGLKEARERLKESPPDFIILDWLLQDGQGMELLTENRLGSQLPVVVMTSHGSEQVAVETMKAGALDYVVKSEFTFSEMPHIVERALRQWNLVMEKKRAEDALRESEERFRRLVKLAPLPLCFVSEDGVLSYANDRFVKMFGYHPEDVPTLREWWPRAYPDEGYRRWAIGTWEAAVKRAVEEKTDIVPGEYKVTCRDGSVRIVEISGIIMESDLLAIFVDVTERRQAADALMESQVFLQSTLDALSAHIAILDEGGEIVFVNEAWRRFGRENDSLMSRDGIGLNYLQVCDSATGGWSEDAAMIAGMIRQIAAGQSEEFQWQYPCHSPLQKRWFVLHATRFFMGGRARVVLAHENITERKRVEEDLVRLAAAIDQAAETVVITDNEGTILYVNPAFERTTGYSRGEAIGNNPRILKSGLHDADFYKLMWDTITGGAVWHGHLITRRKDATLFEEEATISPIKDESGKIINYVAVKRDVTREVSLQKQLLQAQKMEAIGTLAGGVAHDFNNLLQVVLGYCELLLQEKTAENPEYADLQKIFHAGKSGAELVRGLLTFSRKVEARPIPINLNRQIMHVEKLLTRTIPKMVDIRMNLVADLPEINADPTQMEQILMNLALNARDAMPDGGSLTIGTKTVTLDEQYCRYSPDLLPGDYVLLTVEDTGHGMDKTTAEHIFEPFFTTKEPGRGTGLGLAMVYGIVKQHGGHINCYSEVGRGTTFKIYLPALSPRPEVTEESVVEIPPGGSETVLLVDDEDTVRELGRRILSASGYTVLTAVNGVPALDIYRREKDRIHLVILDIIMPVMGGKDCLKEILKIEPQAKVLVASGLAADPSTRECLDLGAKAFVPKPFGYTDLLKEVRRTLDQK